MTESQLELFNIYCADFARDLAFFQKQSNDQQAREILGSMIANIRLARIALDKANG